MAPRSEHQRIKSALGRTSGRNRFQRPERVTGGPAAAALRQAFLAKPNDRMRKDVETRDICGSSRGGRGVLKHSDRPINPGSGTDP